MSHEKNNSVSPVRARRPWVALLLALLAIAGGDGGRAAAPHAGGAERLYVSDETGGHVVIVDPQRASVVARIAVGKRPRGIQLSPDGRTLYVALTGSPLAGPGVDESQLPPPDRRYDGIGVVDLRSQRLVSTYPSGADPEAFALSHDGKVLYVSNEDSGRLSAVDLLAGVVRATAVVGSEPEGVAVSRDNRIVYVACETANEIYVIDAQRMTTLARIPTASRPRAILLAGRRGYATDESAGALTVFDTDYYQVVKTIPLGDPHLVRPMGIASHDGRRLLVTTGRFGALLEIDAGSGRIVRTVGQVGKRPWGVALSRDGETAYTANGPSGDVAVIDLKSGRVVERIAVGGSPWGIVRAAAPQ